MTGYFSITVANGIGCGTRARTSFANFSMTTSRFSPAMLF